jgi:hypothetical protein
MHFVVNLLFQSIKQTHGGVRQILLKRLIPKQKPDHLFDVPIVKRVKWGETIVELGCTGNNMRNLAVF